MEDTNTELLNRKEGIYKKDKKLMKSHLLSQYNIYMNRFDMEMDHTMKKENLYLGVNSLIISGYFPSKNYFINCVDSFFPIILLIMTLDLIWLISMINANTLKKSQLFILRIMEEELPARPLSFERNQTIFKNVKIKFGFLRILLPVIFVIYYILMITIKVNKIKCILLSYMRLEMQMVIRAILDFIIAREEKIAGGGIGQC